MEDNLSDNLEQVSKEVKPSLGWLVNIFFGVLGIIFIVLINLLIHLIFNIEGKYHSLVSIVIDITFTVILSIVIWRINKRRNS